MRFCLLAAVVSPMLALPCAAQVTTNDQALPPATLPAPVAKPPTPPKHAHVTTPKPAPVARRLPVPPLAAAPPANPVIPPPAFILPSHKPPPPPPIPFNAQAPGTASPIQGGTRIVFGPNVADLNEATRAAVLAIAAEAQANPTQIITITAWAPGTQDDPSTPRRLALDRALAARAVLINAGVLSVRIHAVAMGMLEIGQGQPDRADIVLAPPVGKK